MSVVLAGNSYGKSKVRLTKVSRKPDRHELAEWDVAIQLQGDFAPAYIMGDNRQVIATDTMKNTVYALAADLELTSPEAFARTLGAHFLSRYLQVESLDVEIRSARWQRVDVSGEPSPHAFIGGGPEERVGLLSQSRERLSLQGGLDRLLILKTADSAWRDFHRDEFRALPDVDDRILATELTANWRYSEGAIDHDAVFAAIRQTLIETFAGHKSLGAQHTLHAMGAAVLEQCSAIDEIELIMPNRHRIPFDLRPFQRENRNEIFIATDEPHGLISGILRRSSAPHE
jgi:urate oxidase